MIFESTNFSELVQPLKYSCILNNTSIEFFLINLIFNAVDLKLNLEYFLFLTDLLSGLMLRNKRSSSSGCTESSMDLSNFLTDHDLLDDDFCFQLWLVFDFDIELGKYIFHFFLKPHSCNKRLHFGLNLDNEEQFGRIEAKLTQQI